MIAEALDCVADDLNAHFRRVQGDNLDRIILSALVDTQQSGPPIETENKVVLTVAALDEEKNVLNGASAALSAATSARYVEPIYLNLHVVFAATHKHYPTALTALSSVIAYLKAKPVFDPLNTPALPEGIRQLNFNLEKLGYADLCNLWSYLGSSYLPSVNYTIRMVGVGSRRLESAPPAVGAVEVSG